MVRVLLAACQVFGLLLVALFLWVVWPPLLLAYAGVLLVVIGERPLAER